MAILIETRVPLAARSVIRSKLEALQGRARRLGVPPFGFSIGDPFRLEPVRMQGKNGPFLTPAWWVNVTVEGEPPSLQGWTFVATIEDMGKAGHLVKKVPGAEVEIPRNLDPQVCEHCRTRRQRKETFILEHEDGTLRQVGRECLKDFLGNDVAAVVARAGLLAEIAADLSDEDEDFYGSGNGTPEYEDLDKFLGFVALCVRLREGLFISSKMVQEGKYHHPTSGMAMHAIGEARKRIAEGVGVQELREQDLWPSPADRELGRAAREWALALPSTSDFNINLQVIARAGYVSFKNMGIAAYIVGGYLRETQQARERQGGGVLLPKEQQRHVGTVGERREFDAILLGQFVTEGVYGTTHIYRLAIDGSQAVWFASKQEPAFLDATDRAEAMRRRGEDTWLYPLPPGPFRITATVKDHKENRKQPGVPETVLTRVTVWTEEGIRQAAEKAARKAARGAAAPKAPRAPRAPRAVKPKGLGDVPFLVQFHNSVDDTTTRVLRSKNRGFVVIVRPFGYAHWMEHGADIPAFMAAYREATEAAATGYATDPNTPVEETDGPDGVR